MSRPHMAAYANNTKDTKNGKGVIFVTFVVNGLFLFVIFFAATFRESLVRLSPRARGERSAAPRKPWIDTVRQ
jgi:heme/copper-type cytochrome/quinol oxidase subunit 3